jgi:hypothetical protein
VNKWSKSLLKYLGAEIRPLGDDTYRVRLGREMRVELPGQVRERHQITFNYRQAIDETLLDYGSFGHPLFEALLNHITSGAFSGGLTAQRTLVSAQHEPFEGIQFNFLAKVGEVERVVTVAVGLDGHLRQDLRDLLLDTFDWRNEQRPLTIAAVPDWPTRVPDLREVAEEAIERELRSEVAGATRRAQERHEAERRKLTQYFTFRETEGRRKLAHHEAVVARLAASAREEDHRVIPLWERTVANASVYLEKLAAERERQNEGLADRLEVGYSYELLSAASVVVCPPSRGAGGDAAFETDLDDAEME